MTNVCPYTWVYIKLTSKPRAHASWVSPLLAEPQGSTEADQQSFAGRWHQNQLSGYLCVLGFYGGLRYTRRLGAPSQRELWDCVPPCTQDRQLSVTVPCRLLGLDSLRFPHPLPLLVPTDTWSHRLWMQRRTCDIMECQKMWERACDEIWSMQNTFLQVRQEFCVVPFPENHPCNCWLEKYYPWWEKEIQYPSLLFLPKPSVLISHGKMEAAGAQL